MRTYRLIANKLQTEPIAYFPPPSRKRKREYSEESENPKDNETADPDPEPLKANLEEEVINALPVVQLCCVYEYAHLDQFLQSQEFFSQLRHLPPRVVAEEPTESTDKDKDTVEFVPWEDAAGISSSTLQKLMRPCTYLADYCGEALIEEMSEVFSSTTLTLQIVGHGQIETRSPSQSTRITLPGFPFKVKLDIELPVVRIYCAQEHVDEVRGKITEDSSGRFVCLMNMLAQAYREQLFWEIINQSDL